MKELIEELDADIHVNSNLTLISFCEEELLLDSCEHQRSGVNVERN